MIKDEPIGGAGGLKKIVLITLSLAAVTLLIGRALGLIEANRTYGLGFLVVCGLLTLLLFEGAPAFEFIAGGVTLVAFLIFFGSHEFGNWRRGASVEEANIRCAIDKAGVPEDDREYVAVRVGIIREVGNKNSAQTEIEQRLGIKILPNCQFVRA